MSCSRLGAPLRGGRKDGCSFLPLVPMSSRKMSLAISQRRGIPITGKVDTDGNQLPYIDRLMALQNIEVEVATAKAMAGEFDYARASLDDYVLLRENEEAGNYKVHLWNVVGSTHFGIQINQTYAQDLVLRDIFRDVRFRRALSLAIIAMNE